MDFQDSVKLKNLDIGQEGVRDLGKIGPKTSN